MKSEILRRLLKKLPPGVSINLPSISVDPGTLAEHISKDAAPGELVELNQQLAGLARNASDAFGRLEADLATAGVKNQQQFEALLAALQATLLSAQPHELPPCFLPAADAFSALIAGTSSSSSTVRSLITSSSCRAIFVGYSSASSTTT